jgi:hypothetical protein
VPQSLWPTNDWKASARVTCNTHVDDMQTCYKGV